MASELSGIKRIRKKNEIRIYYFFINYNNMTCLAGFWGFGVLGFWGFGV